MKKITQTELLILELEKLKHENTEIKKLLKESVEKFVTKEFAERVYQWIGRPVNELLVPNKLPKKDDGEIPY